ncbi:MAG: hypothetical protein [Olavius algarvensis Delta 4 endosymbiont]|nr:MAG: hypothetical protein [Olavius algarvensis Delta 4 endosymbiont]
MPIRIEYLEDNGVAFKGAGVVTFTDLKSANDSVYASQKKIKAISYQIVDLATIDNIDLSSEDLEQLAHQDQYAFGVNPDIRIAVVGPQDLTFGLARVWEAYACQMNSPQACKIFRKRQDALEWVAQSKKST